MAGLNASALASFSLATPATISASHDELSPWSRSHELAGICRPFKSWQKDQSLEVLPQPWRSPGAGIRASLSGIMAVFTGKNERQNLKEELLEAIKPVDRGAEASPEDAIQIDKIAKKLESRNPTKEPLKSPLINGKWQLIYTTSRSILKKDNPKFLRPWGPIYQSINADTLRAQNMETSPFFNQVTANLVPLSSSKVAVKFDIFKIGGLISIKAPGRARGELEVTYLDADLRISRGDKGNLFVLEMKDPSYRVPT